MTAVPLICVQTGTNLQTAYRHVFTNLSLVSYTTVCSYQSLKENCMNAAELPFNALQNFAYCLAIYHLCSRIFFSWTKLRRKIALCSSELSLDTPWNFMQTFIEKSREQRTKFAQFACIAFVQYCIFSWILSVWKCSQSYVHQCSMFNETGNKWKKNETSTLGPKRPGWSERINDISFNAVLR